MPRAIRLVLAALLALLATPAFAESFPAFTGLVVDAAHVLPDDRKAALTAKLQAFWQASAKQGLGRQLVVATVPSLEGEDIQQYGVALLRAWGVGLKGADTGVILLIAPSEHKIGIETGPGTNGVLTDAYASVIINGKIRPAFKAGDLPGGIDAGADAIIQLLSQPDDQARARAASAITAYDKQHRNSGGEGAGAGLIVGLFIVGFVVLAVSRRRGLGQRYQSGTSYGAGGNGGTSWPILLWALDSALSERRQGSWTGSDSWGSGGSSFGGSGDSGGGGWGDGGFTGGGGGSGDGGGASGSW